MADVEKLRAEFVGALAQEYDSLRGKYRRAGRLAWTPAMKAAHALLGAAAAVGTEPVRHTQIGHDSTHLGPAKETDVPRDAVEILMECLELRQCGGHGELSATPGIKVRIEDAIASIREERERAWDVQAQRDRMRVKIDKAIEYSEAWTANNLRCREIIAILRGEP